MSWFRNTSLSLARQLSRSLDPRHDYEPQACYASFCKHWQQAHDIIQKSQGRAVNYRKPQHLHDDVLGVVNHLEQLSTLLVLEARAREIHNISNPAACLEYLLSENLLDKLYEWAVCTGKYENAVRLEQLRLFGSLIGYYSTQVIAAEPFLRPLLKLLSSFRNQLPPPNLETQLVSVLNQLCVVLMQNMKFIDLFFLMTHTQNGSQAEFIIGRLLLSSVHREGATGSAARDALLLCAKMSSRCAPLAHCLLTGNACPVLATGLSGLYSLLPRTLDDSVYRLTPDDVNQVHKLTLFVDSLEFCNAVAQVAHPSIKKHLLDLLYQGFLVPVLGPALLQSVAASPQSGRGEQAAAAAYLELVLRAASRAGLLRPTLHFLLTHRYDAVRLLDVLLARLDGTSQLSLVTLSLMETLIDLNCEDVMLELVFKYLLNGRHLAPSYRDKITDPEPYRESAMAFLELSPKCCSRPLEKTREWVEELALSGRKVLDLRADEERRINGVNGDIAMSNLVHEVNFDYGNPNETLFANYHAYICDARFELVSRTIACTNWSSKYDTVISPKREANNNSTKDMKEIEHPAAVKEQDSLISVCTSGYGTLKTSDTSEKEPHSLTSLNEVEKEEGKHDSLTSFGESSGYDSLRFRSEDNDDSDMCAEESFRKSIVKEQQPTSVSAEYDEGPSVSSWRVSAETIIGPLLAGLLRKAGALLQCEVAGVCRVTSALSKLAALPAPLLAAALLCVRAPLHHSVPSLYLILSRLKEEVDQLTRDLDNIDELVDQARVFLIQREMALIKSRAQPNDNRHARQPPNLPAGRQEESPFRRMESKRRSISSSFSNMFHRKPAASPSQPSPHQGLHIMTNTVQRPSFTQEAYWNQSIKHRAVLNAVLLDEWLKELSALCHEHALRLSADVCEDESYVRSVNL